MENAVSQHLRSLNDVQLAQVDRALTRLEAQLFPPAAHDGDPQPAGDRDIRSTPIQRSGKHSVLAKLDPVRERLQRLQRLARQARDAEASLVNDALNWQAYLLLQGAITSSATDAGDSAPGPTQLLSV